MIERRRSTADRPERTSPAAPGAEYFVTCGECNAVLAVQESALGRRRRCPVCREHVAIPAERGLLREVPDGFAPRITGAADGFRARLADSGGSPEGRGEPPWSRRSSSEPPRRTLRAARPTTVVLVVDDSPNVREAATAILASAGVQAATAASGAEAIEWVRGRTPDLILLDTSMPGIDGYETCRRLRERPELASVPIVMLGGDNPAINRLHARMAGATAALSKPCDAETLLAALAELVPCVG